MGRQGDGKTSGDSNEREQRLRCWNGSCELITNGETCWARAQNGGGSSGSRGRKDKTGNAILGNLNILLEVLGALVLRVRGGDCAETHLGS